MSKIKVDVVGLLPMKKQMSLLLMPARKRQRLMARVAKKVIRQSKKRVRDQRDLNGVAFPTRKRKRARKMLSKLVKQLKVVQANGTGATVGFSNPVVGKIAADQQYGKKTVMTARGMATRSKESYNLPATRKQAKALIDAGFKVKRAKGKGTKSPGIKHIVSNYSQGQAGATLKKLRIWAGDKPLTSWVTQLPARSFLGATATDVQQYVEQIFDDMQQELARGHR